MGELLFSTFIDEETGGVVLPYRRVAELAGVHPHRHGFSAERTLEDFSRNVFPLQIDDYRWVDERARSVRFELHPQVEEARLRDQLSDPDHPMVDLATGLPVSRREQERQRRSRRESLRERMSKARDRLPEGHPGRRILSQMLRGQKKSSQIVKGNLPQARAYIEGVPVDTPKQRERRDGCLRVYHAVREDPALCYAGSGRTCRLFAQGENVHQFPREIRRLLFAGCYECDLKAAQLAIIARDWGIERLRAFLERSLQGGPSIWQMLADETGMPLESVKPLLKRSVYAAVFGGARKTVQDGLSHGVDGEPGLGKPVARRLMRHWLFADLFQARRRRIQDLNAAGGATDCFGQEHLVGQEGRNARSVLAALVQAQEMQIMLAVVEVIERNPQIYLVSWLHDGVALWFGNTSKEERWKRQIQDAVRARAQELGFPTALEVEPLHGSSPDRAC